MKKVEVKTMKNIKNFKPVDLGGKKIEVFEMSKLIGNAVYFSAQDVSILEVGKKIYNDEDFVVSEMLINSAKGIGRQVAPWLTDQFIKFLEKE